MAVRDEDGSSPPPRTEGYKREDTEYGDLIRVEVFACNATRLLQELSALFRSPTLFLLETPGEETPDGPGERQTWQSKPLPAARILKRLEPYLFRLLHDGNLAFGLGAPQEMEIFVTEHKIFRIYSSEPDRVESALRSHGLREMPGKVFADEIPLYALLDLNVVPSLYRDKLRDPRDLSFLEDPSYHYEAVAEELQSLFEMTLLEPDDEDDEDEDDDQKFEVDDDEIEFFRKLSPRMDDEDDDDLDDEDEDDDDLDDDDEDDDDEDDEDDEDDDLDDEDDEDDDHHK